MAWGAAQNQPKNNGGKRDATPGDGGIHERARPAASLWTVDRLDNVRAPWWVLSFPPLSSIHKLTRIKRFSLRRRSQSVYWRMAASVERDHDGPGRVVDPRRERSKIFHTLSGEKIQLRRVARQGWPGECGIQGIVTGCAVPADGRGSGGNGRGRDLGDGGGVGWCRKAAQFAGEKRACSGIRRCNGPQIFSWRSSRRPALRMWLYPVAPLPWRSKTPSPTGAINLIRMSLRRRIFPSFTGCWTRWMRAPFRWNIFEKVTLEIFHVFFVWMWRFAGLSRNFTLKNENYGHGELLVR